MSTTMTVRLEDEVKDRLDVLAEATQRSKSFLAAEAIRVYIESNEWQIGEIQAALKEADAGDFASDKDVAVLARKWKANAGLPGSSRPLRPDPRRDIEGRGRAEAYRLDARAAGHDRLRAAGGHVGRPPH